MLQQIRSSLDWVASGIFDRPSKPSKAALVQIEHAKVMTMLNHAMLLLEECSPPRKGHDGPCTPDTACDSECATLYHWVEEYMSLVKLHREWSTTQVTK